MEKHEFDIKNYAGGYSKSLQDYIQLLKLNLKAFLIIFTIISAAAIAYALLATNIYESTVTLKIMDQKPSVLQTNSASQSNLQVSDRFIANEIEIIESYQTRLKTAEALIDTLKNLKNKGDFSLLSLKKGETGVNGYKKVSDVAGLLKGLVKVEQKNGMDIVELTASSTSPGEAAVIANTYAGQYKKLNLQANRRQLTEIRQFLENQCKDKLKELHNAEFELADFKRKGGIVQLDAQSRALIDQISQLDAERDAVRIDLGTSNAILDQYKKQISGQDPQLADYLESQTSQAYINVLQKQIAELQMNKDLALANKNSNVDVTNKIKEYDRKINDLKQKLSAKINEIKTGAFSSSPDQIKVLSQRLIEEEVKNNSLSKKLNELQSIIDNYEVSLSRLPKKSMDFANYERNANALQHLYTMLEQKFQTAEINELSQPGNVYIIGEGRIPDKPSKPKRPFIVLVGVILGFGAAFGYVLLKDNFDDTIKSPEDIQKKDIKLLTWIPKLKSEKNKDNHSSDLIVLEDPHAAASEAFKVLRARILVNIDQRKPVKTIMISSAWQGEGKTMVAVNLAYSLAQLKKRTLLIDCDLRRPRIHRIMNVTKTPGIIEYMTSKAALKDIVRRSRLEYMRYITSGQLKAGSTEYTDTLKEAADRSKEESIRFINSGNAVADPTELFAKDDIRNFLKEMKTHFDYVIIDSAPLVSVIDSEVLAKYVDGIMLVVSANTTENKLMNETLKLIKDINSPFLGIVLNNFKYKVGYDYYFKYHYKYSNNGNGRT